jgi:uncharacterized protein YlaI
VRATVRPARPRRVKRRGRELEKAKGRRQYYRQALAHAQRFRRFQPARIRRVHARVARERARIKPTEGRTGGGKRLRHGSFRTHSCEAVESRVKVKPGPRAAGLAASTYPGAAWLAKRTSNSWLSQVRAPAPHGAPDWRTARRRSMLGDVRTSVDARTSWYSLTVSPDGPGVRCRRRTRKGLLLLGGTW